MPGHLLKSLPFTEGRGHFLRIFFFLQIQLGGEYEQSVFYHVHRDNTVHIYFILCQSKACTESADFIHGKVDVGKKIQSPLISPYNSAPEKSNVKTTFLLEFKAFDITTLILLG